VSRSVSAKLVRDVRTRLGLTQEKFASRLGVSFPTVSRWENDRSKPSPLAYRQLEEIVKQMQEDGADLLEKYFATNAG
jgi:DNA-binding transcriptional regulator YiaG